MCIFICMYWEGSVVGITSPYYGFHASLWWVCRVRLSWVYILTPTLHRCVLGLIRVFAWGTTYRARLESCVYGACSEFYISICPPGFYCPHFDSCATCFENKSRYNCAHIWLHLRMHQHHRMETFVVLCKYSAAERNVMMVTTWRHSSAFRTSDRSEVNFCLSYFI